MRHIVLGKTGLIVSRLGLGTDVLGEDGQVTVAQETDVILRAWELGINLIDTDRWYRTYPSIAAALPHMDRSRLVLVTKTYEKTYQGALDDVRYALDALGTDYIDLFLLHAVNTLEEYMAFAPALEALQEARSRGWVRHIGLSTHTVAMTRAAADYPKIEAILTVLNLAGKNMSRSGTRAEMEAAITRAHVAGLGIYIMKPFARGRLFDDHNKDRPLTPEQTEQALAYLYGLPFIHAVIPGMRTIAQVEQCVAIVERLLAPSAAPRMEALA